MFFLYPKLSGVKSEAICNEQMKRNRKKERIKLSADAMQFKNESKSFK